MFSLKKYNLTNSFLKASFLSVMIFSLASCSVFKPYKFPKEQGTIVKQEQVDLLQAGLTPNQVRTILGPAFGIDAFNPRHWEYVFYTTNTEIHQNTVNHIILTFDNEAFLEDWIVQASNVKLKTNQGFFESLFDSF
jgi:outer membrane protein assembly factor BamE